MKNILIISILLLTINIFGEDTIPANFYTFEGVGSKLDGKKTTETPMNAQTDYVYNKLHNKSVVLVGHSQGGVRALSFAKRMTDAGKADQIKAIVTIGSPVNGHSSLIGGPNAVKRRVDSIPTAFVSGIEAMESSLRLPGPVDLLREIRNLVKISENDPFYINHIYFNIIVHPMIETLFKTSAAGMADLNPASDFFKKNIKPEVTPTQKEITRKKKVRDKLVVTIVPITITLKNGRVINTYERREEWTYKYITITQTVKYAEVTPRIDSSVPIGFIVGQNNNAYSLISELTSLDKNSRENLEDLLGPWRVGFDNARIIHNLRAKVSISPFKDFHKKESREAKAARDLADDVNNIIGQILGSNKNDGLILESDQKTSIKRLGGKAIKPGDEYIVEVAEHHIAEMNAKTVWGEKSVLTGHTGLTKANYSNSGAVYNLLNGLEEEIFESNELKTKLIKFDLPGTCLE